MADRPGLPDLTHQWYRSTAGHFCSLCAAPLVDSGADPCFARVIAYADEQRTAGAAEARARILAHLHRPSSAEEAAAYLRPVYPAVSVDDLELRWNGGDPAWTWRGRIVCFDRDVMRARRTEADAIERGEDRTP